MLDKRVCEAFLFTQYDHLMIHHCVYKTKQIMVAPADSVRLVSMIFCLRMVEDQQENSLLLNKFLRDVVHDRLVLSTK